MNSLPIFGVLSTICATKGQVLVILGKACGYCGTPAKRG